MPLSHWSAPLNAALSLVQSSGALSLEGEGRGGRGHDGNEKTNKIISPWQLYLNYLAGYNKHAQSDVDYQVSHR